MLEDLRALVEFAHAGSIAGAAGRLFRTPSAITRQVQRLEAALGAELLDRSVKPPRLNSLGSPARDPVLERDLHGGFHGFGTARGVDDRLEVRSALRQQQMGQLFERLAADKDIGIRMRPARADSRSPRSPRGCRGRC